MAAVCEELEESQSPWQSILEAALTAQRTFMDRYGDPLEQILTIMVYLIPVKDEEDDKAGFRSQAVYSVIDLFNLYRSALMRSMEQLPVTLPEGVSFTNGAMSPSKMKTSLQKSRMVYVLSAFALRVLRSVQVLIEMHAAQKWGMQHALRVCVRIELFKLALKLVVRAHMPFSFYIDEEALDEAEPPKLPHNSFLGPPPEPEAAPMEVYTGRRSGKQLPPLGAGTNSANSAPPRTAVGLKEDSSSPSFSMALSEVLFHSKPFIHLAALMRYGRQSWLAWSLALIIDRLSLGLLLTKVKPRVKSRAAALELAEVYRRRNQIWWVLIRSPAFERFLSRPCAILDSILKKVPVINLFNIVELFLALQPFYFTTSGT